MISIRLQPRPTSTRRPALPSTCRQDPHDLDPRLRLRVSAYRPLAAIFRSLVTDLVVVGVVAGPAPGSSRIQKTCPCLFLRERADRFLILWQEGGADGPGKGC